MGEWRETTLGALCEAIVDCEHKTAPLDPAGEYFAVGTPAMQGNTIDYARARRVSESTFEAWTRRLRPRFGDLLLAREAPVGPVVRIPREENVAPGQRTVLIRPGAGTDSRFLHYLLTSAPVQAEMASKAEGSTVSHLNVADVRLLPVSAPLHESEQRAIADVLGALDDKIAANTRGRRAAWDLASAEFDRAVLAAPGSASLGEVVRLVYGKALPEDVRRPGPVLVFGSGGPVGSHDVALVDEAGPVVGRKGTAGAVHWAPGPHFPIDTAFAGRPARPEFSTLFCYFTLARARLEERNSDSAVPGLNRTEAEAVRVPVPSTTQLARFTEAAQPLIDIATALDAESTSLAAARDALLPELMSGALRVRDAERAVSDLT